MAANPISFTEIEAFNRITLAGLTPWDIALIRRIDDAILASRSDEPEEEEKPTSLRDFLRAHNAKFESTS